MAVGVGLTALRQGVNLGSIALRRRLLVSLEIHNRDRAYEWFLMWMAHQTAASSTQRWIRSHNLSVVTAFQKQKNGTSSVAFDLVAGPGTHWLKYRGAWMQVCVISTLSL